MDNIVPSDTVGIEEADVGCVEGAHQVDPGPNVRLLVDPANIWTNLESMHLVFYQGVHKVPYNMIFFPNPIFKIFTETSVPFPFYPLDILPNSLNIIDQMLLLPLNHFSTLDSSPLNNLIFFPNRLYTLLYFTVLADEDRTEDPAVPSSTFNNKTTDNYWKLNLGF